MLRQLKYGWGGGDANAILAGTGTRGLLVTSYFLELLAGNKGAPFLGAHPSRASVIPTTQVQQRFLVVALRVLLQMAKEKEATQYPKKDPNSAIA